ncbi:hypothetical protein [[Mycobacterium] crassicus]|uniref:Uncharacterized protein n=1 Tax=[Mycobacterium] crassicus TaxID=2872309 RepID=A0ABU5XD70_9MYCO|nr:hypothetical protein [Mycolicibacter sp. MYC098]MEB3020131.1 hypothetical protein [Mycolicibacter sp. MYC098]
MRRLGVLATLAAALLAGCPSKAPWAPSLPPAFGARVTNGKLEIWTGSRCDGITRIVLSFDPSAAELILTSRTEVGVAVDHLTLGGPYPAGMTVSQHLPVGFEWRNQKSMDFSTYGGSSRWGTTTDLDVVRGGSEQHPTDSYWFQDVGWLNPAQVAAQDGKSFLATCTADPAKKG